MTLAKIHKDRVVIKSIFGEHFNDVPKHSSKNQVTLLEEDKISAYYAGWEYVRLEKKI
jgi:photosynthetic reaction center H subunit